MYKGTTYLILFLLFSQLCVGQSYETILIGDQEWMKYNLEIDLPGSIYYDNDSTNCDDCGRLYLWQSALDVCPDGFRLPTDRDWNVLTEYLGGVESAGVSLIEEGSSGFDAKLAGNYQAKLGIFSYRDLKGYYWTATSYSINTAWVRSIGAGQKNVNRTTIDKNFYFSVRCIKDN